MKEGQIKSEVMAQTCAVAMLGFGNDIIKVGPTTCSWIYILFSKQI